MTLIFFRKGGVARVQVTPVNCKQVQFNIQKLRHGHAHFRQNLGDMSGLCLGTCLSNLKSVSLAVLEQLAFNAQKFIGVS